jgi:tripartite-type tricarboxylate transporter receptor subunit TctC
LFCAALGATALGLALPAAAQTYPTRQVRLVIPLTAGSGADIVARALAPRLTELWGQPVVVENRPGAGGQIGTREVVRAAPDGYTLLVQSASHAVNPAIYKSLPYDPTRDLIDVALLATTPYVMVTNGSGPYQSVAKIVEAAKAKPESLAYASAGVGTSTHLAAELFAQKAGVRMVHVPFKGSPDAITDLLGGRSSFYMAPLPTVAGMLKDGKLTPVAVTSTKRLGAWPNVPTMAESGVKDFRVDLWFGLWAPAGTPAPIVTKLSADITKLLQSPDTQAQYARAGNEVQIMTPAEFAKYVRDEIETNKAIVKAAGIQPE